MFSIIQNNCLEDEFPHYVLELVFALMAQEARFGEIAMARQPVEPVVLVSKGDYAEQKFPHCARSTALKKLSQAIRSNPSLAAELRKAGYRANAHTLTPEQVAILERYTH